MSYTPGPWHVVGRTRVSRRGISTFDVLSGNGNPENWDMLAERIEGVANARLIASAPELLGILKQIVHCKDYNAIVSTYVEKARALLREIEGEEA